LRFGRPAVTPPAASAHAAFSPRAADRACQPCDGARHGRRRAPLPKWNRRGTYCRSGRSPTKKRRVSHRRSPAPGAG